MSKKIVAMLMAVAMAFSLLPVTAFATGETQEGNSQTPVIVKKSENNLAMTKTVTPKGDGTYTVSLESYATGSVTTTQAPVPMDFVLVLDVSGSMDGENGQIVSYDYQKTQKTSWSARDIYYARTTYYAKIGDEYYPVSYQSKWVPDGYFSGHTEYWLEANGQPLGKTGGWNDKLYSGSLYTYGEVPGSKMSKLKAMKTAVNNFIDSVAAQKNGDTPVAHRISIVKFAGDPSDKVSNDTYQEYGDTYNYTQKVKELTDVTAAGSVASLKNAVNALTAGGATAADWGMQKAKDVLTKRGDNPNPSSVIMFTDGEPNHGSGYKASVAGDTVQAAKALKDSGTKVYTIGMFTGADPTDTAYKFNIYMNGVSSNYPEAVEAYNISGVTLGKRAEGNYYFKADNAGDLDRVFQTISQSTTVTSPLDDKAVVVDNVPSNFALTEGSVKVYTANCIAKNGETFEWGKKTESTIRPTIDKQSISVTGFKFSENWCGIGENKQARGQKLIIEFTISRTNYGGTQPTNAGAYIKAGKVENEEPIISLKDPQVPVTIELNKTLGVNDEKPYDGKGLAILTKIATQANTLANGTNNAYVDMELTVKVDDTTGETTYTYKIPAKAKTGSWYQGDHKMEADAVSKVKTSPNVNRGENNAVEPYTYKFDLMLSDAAPNGAAAPAEYKNNTASFKITPRDVKVKAEDKSVVAGQPAPTYTAEVTGTIGQETVNYDFSCAYDPATSTEGTIPIVLTGADTQGNYNVSYENGTLTVTKAPVTTGTLKVTKEVQGENLTLDNLLDGFKITVTAGEDQEPIDLTLNGTNYTATRDNANTTATWTISDLTPGTYTVSESNADVKDYTYTAKYNGVAATQANSATVDVTAGGKSTMTVTNTYTENAKVNLSQLIQKQLTVKEGSTLPDNTKFTVTVTPKNGGTQDAIIGTTTSQWTGGIEAEGNTTYTVPFDFKTKNTLSLPAGTHTYTVQEIKGDVSGMQYDSNTYTLKITVTGSSYSAEYTTTNEEKVTPVTADSPLTIKNTYQTPDLSVEKKTYKVNNVEFKPGETVAHVNDQIVWKVNVTNNKTTQASTQLTETLAGVAVYSKEKFTDANKVQLDTNGTWTAMVPANKTVTYYVTYTVKADDIPKGEIVNTIVKDGDKKNSDPVSTWDTKQLKSAKELDTSDWTTTVTLTLPMVSKTEANSTGTKAQPDPITAISKGSYVIDQIGNKFTFKNGLSLEVNGKEISVTQDETNKNLYHFRTETGGTDLYTVTYTDKNDETKTPAQFKWEINQDIPAGTKVTLSYNLELTTREKNPGTYGPIYTNEKAALYIKENDQEKEIAVFPKPSVSYTIKSNSGSHSGGSRPSLNTKDHYGYIIGYPVDYYTGQPTTDQTKKPVRPEGKITRAEVATIYFRMLTDESRTKFWSQSNAYSDVKTGDWFNNAVSTLSNAGIIAGYEDGSFRPNGYITRAEFATIAARFFDVTYNGKDLFPDISGHWAKDYINQAANKGFVNGYEDGTFKPDRNITRAEAVTLVNRTLDRHPDKSHFTKDMLVWPDNMDQTKWYYADMQEATNSHTYQMKENSDKTKYENWTKTLPIRNWEALEKAWSNANSSQGNGNVV